MKQVLISCVLLCATLSGAAATNALSWADAGQPQSLQVKAKVERFAPETPADYQVVAIDRSSANEVSATSAPAKKHGVARRAATSVADLAGNYVMVSQSCVGYGTPGREVTVSPISGTDSIAINGFWSAGITVKAKVDFAKSTVTIPSQYLYTHTDYGPMDLAPVTTNGVPLRDQSILGTINADGTMSFDTWWCIAINSGEFKDEIVDANRATVLERPNGTMTYAPDGGQPITFGVVVSQPTTNILKVKNFVNRGATIEVTLNGERNGYIASQTAYITSNGTYVTVGNPILNEDGQLIAWSPAIPLNIAPETEKREISWGNWTMYLANKSYAGLLSYGSVTTDFDIAYPPTSSISLKGAGTAEDPYQIANLSDLILLANMVNTDPDRSGALTSATQTVNYAKSQLGKFFKLTSDIDMSGYRANPIGWDVIHQFCGTFDGDGHTISGLNIEAGGMAGLFGMADTASVIKNVNLKSPVITSTGNYYAGGVAAYSVGLIENCNVDSPEVNQAGQVGGGVVGYSNNVTNCHVTSGTVYTRYGFAGGVAGQVNGTISNSSATDTYVVSSSSASADPRVNGGSPLGGVIGSLFKGTAINCHFSGTVDGYTPGVSVYSGGIAGINHLGVIDQCFFAGTLMGIGSGSVNGGIAGYSSGKVTNSYSTGLVDCISSYYTGGITGRLFKDGTNPEPEVRNSFTTAQVRAESYQYNTEEEMRETIGRVWTGTSPVVSNVYFDNQITNFRSTRGGLSNSEFTSGNPITGLDNTVWTYTKDAYPRLKSQADAPVSMLAASAILMPQAATTLQNINTDVTLSAMGDTKFYLLNNGKVSEAGHFCSISNGQLEINKEYKMGNDTIVAMNGKSFLRYFIKVAPKFLEGEGTEENPYLLKNKDDLLALAEATSEKELVFANTWFALTNDIDMENDPAFKGISFTSKTAVRFAGVIDGKGYTIHNMKLDFVTWTTPPTENSLGVLNSTASTSYIGFVSKLAATGVVKNLTIASDCFIQGLGTVGALVGTSYGVIENCRNYAPVTGLASGVGGMAGKLETGSKVINCFNAGYILTGYQGVAGIAGSGTGFEIIGCANTGLIEARPLCTARDESSTVLKYAAGIAGNVGGTFTVADCADYGHSYAWTGTVGSICGRSYGTPTLTGNLALGTLESKDVVAIGMMAGEVPAKVNYTANVWDSQMLTWKAAVSQSKDGAEGVLTSVLVSGEPVAGFAEGAWTYEKGKYPVPATMNSLPEIQAAAIAYFNLPANETVGDLRSDAALPVADKQVWKLAEGSAFSISDNKLVVPKAQKVIQEGVLTVTVNDIYSKSFSLSVLPSLPLDGEGTAESPYLINNADDWTMLANYMESTENTFEGKYLKVTADIDFGSKAASAIANDGKTSFEGTLEGADHTINFTLSGDAQYLGLIGSMGEYGSIRNLTFKGTVNSTGLNVGGVVGKSAGSFYNCVSEVNVTTNKMYAGGFVGLLTGGSFEKCISRAVVNTTNSNAGGFVGQATGCATLDSCYFEGKIVGTTTSTSALNYGGFFGNAWVSDFNDCVNKGEIQVAFEKANGIAGFIGNANGAANNGFYTFKNCRNESDLTIGYGIAGFVAAASTTAGAAPMSFDNCSNTGNLTATYSSTRVAGFIGTASPGTTLKNCVNSGVITAPGGMGAGFISTTGGTFSATNPLTIEDCVNKGEIISAGSQCGGIIGSAPNFTFIKNCSNEAPVSGTMYLGGIVAMGNMANMKIENSRNSGAIVAKGGRVGGIVGSMGGTAAKVGDVLIKNCFNVAPVSTSSTLGGVSLAAANPSGYAIGGLAGYCSGLVEDSYNMGEVKGVSRIGGLVGDPGTNKKLAIARCYNAGKVVAPADTCGAIIGINTDNGKLWIDGCVTDTYYLADCCESTLPLQGTSLTVAELCGKKIGDAYVTPANNCFPILSVNATTPEALLYSGQTIFGEGQSETNVTSDFAVGTPEGVVWTITGAPATVSDGMVKFTEKYKGDAELTATIGELTRTITLKVNVATSGVDEIDGEANVAERAYYTLDGIRTELPAPDGKIYIVVTTYTDGSRKAMRMINK